MPCVTFSSRKVVSISQRRWYRPIPRRSSPGSVSVARRTQSWRETFFGSSTFVTMALGRKPGILYSTRRTVVVELVSSDRCSTLPGRQVNGYFFSPRRAAVYSLRAPCPAPSEARLPAPPPPPSLRAGDVWYAKD